MYCYRCCDFRLGTAEGGIYKILTDKKDYIAKTQGIDVAVNAVLEINESRINELGISKNIVKTNIDDIINDSTIDIVVELIGGTTYAKEFIIKALKEGKAVVSANKELFAKYWHELENIAKEYNAGLYFEASCVGGVL